MSTVQIPLTQGKVAVIDEEDLPLVSGFAWYAQKGGRTFYACAHQYKCRTVLMHRLILACEDGVKVDHKDGNGLNNTRSNLRPATHAENMANRALHRHSRNGYKGVQWCAMHNKWRVTIRKDGHKTHGGYYTDIIMAARAYDAKAKELFGEFARLNFPDK